MEKITSKFRSNPLISILVLAFTVRLIAVIFSQGYLMHDDHFLVIEAAQSWVDGHDYNNWLPKIAKVGIQLDIQCFMLAYTIFSYLY